MKQVEGHHELLNRHTKNWKCVKGAFDVRGSAMEKMEKQKDFFNAGAVAKQIVMQMGVRELCKVQTDQFNSNEDSC